MSPSEEGLPIRGTLDPPGGRSRRIFSLGLAQEIALATTLLTGCADAPAPGQCPSIDEPVLSLANRRGSAPLEDGDEVEVFPPPQGGVFTELDVSIVGVPLSDLEQLHVTFESTDSLGLLASVSYPGSAVPVWCSKDDVLKIDGLPVGFDEAFGLPDLHGESAVLEGVVETRSGEVSVRYDVVLKWTDF